MKFRFPIIIIDEDFRSENTSGLGIRALAKAIEEEGMEVLGVTSYGDLSQFAQQQSRASAFILSIDDEEFADTAVPDSARPVLKNLRAFVEEIRFRNAEIPIYLYGETRTSRHIPNDILRELHGFIHMFEDTPEFVARHIIREARSYLDSLAPPFFRALTHYAQDGSYSWHCPGHSGGVAFLKSPVGQMFHQFFGENMLRADVCNAVDELGQLLDHTGPVAASERNAARIFSADHCFFVTNGTSTSNKMVWHSTVAPDDIVVVDRNCHKSILHAITMTGAIPVFLTPTRNHLGIIGPIPLDEFRPENIQKKIEANPFARNAKTQEAAHSDHHAEHLRWRGLQRRNVKRHAELLRSIRCISTRPGCRTPPSTISTKTCMPSAEIARAPKDSMIFATHSTHKLLAGISQASQILVQESQTQKLDRDVFNEAYLMHTSTSPQYAIIASCDVAAAMMEPPGGTALVEESIAEALDFRRAMRKVDAEFGKDWWFKVWGPEKLAQEGIGSREDWMLRANEKWHGFGNLASGFNMLDPIKATVITPGLDVSGKFAKSGIPASIVTKYPRRARRDRGKNRAVLLLHHVHHRHHQGPLEYAGRPRCSSSRTTTTRTSRCGASCRNSARRIRMYERLGLRDLCDQIHDMYKANDVARLTTEMYLSDMQPAMKPSDAFAAMAHREIDRVEIDQLEGRITSVLLTPYPPGIPLLIPGERFNNTIVRYLQFARDFNRKFPGFDTDIHGLVEEVRGPEIYYFVDCVRQA